MSHDDEHEHDDEDVYDAAPHICPHCGNGEGFTYGGFTTDRKLILICLTCSKSVLVKGHPVDE